MSVTVTVPIGTTPAQAFPNDLADVEQLIYDAVKTAVAPGPGCQLPYYADNRPNSPAVVARMGWPAYPGKVPAIGVAAGTETEDKQRELGQGGFVGDVVAVDTSGTFVGTASYYSEPIYSPVIVELIHENRDERDRLHDALRLVLFPLRRALVAAHPRISKVTVDAERTEQSGGPPISDQPFTLYISVFTVHVFHELLQATGVADDTSVITSVDVTVDVELPGGP